MSGTELHPKSQQQLIWLAQSPKLYWATLVSTMLTNTGHFLQEQICMFDRDEVVGQHAFLHALS